MWSCAEEHVWMKRRHRCGRYTKCGFVGRKMFGWKEE